MSTFARYVGYVWAGPVTLCGLIYVGLFSALRWYHWVGMHGDALVWQVSADKAPAWLNKAWFNWGGHTIGQVVVVKEDIGSVRGSATLVHENVHVRQCMVLGIFWPIVYGLISLIIKVACPSSDPYFSNVLEVDARRFAGQTVDVEGLKKKLAAKGPTKN